MRTGLVLLGLILGSERSPAQQPDTARKARADSSVALPPIEVTSSILPRAGPAVGSGMSARATIVRTSAIEAWRPHGLPDLLTRETGIAVYDDLGSPSKLTLVSRGFTSSPVVGLSQGISVFLDGVPLNDPDAGQVNFDLVPLDHLDRIEILRATAALLGPYSLGGAINLVRRDGASPGGAVEVGGGSERTWSAELANSGRAGPVRYYAGGSFHQRGGWRQLTMNRQLNGIVNAGRYWARSGLRLQAVAASGYAETAGSLPASVYEERPDSNLSAGDFEDLTQVHLALSGYTGLGAGRASALFYYRWNDAERFNVNQVHDPDVRNLATNRSIGAGIEWQLAQLRFGLGGSASDSRVRIYAERLDPGLTTDVRSPISRLDGFAMGDVALGALTLSGGLRFDLVQVPFHNLLDPARGTTSTFTHLSPRLGAHLPLGASASLYASVGRSFRPPALVELACADPEEPCPLPFALGDDPPLDPVVATTVEIGGEGRVGRVAFDLAAYRTSVRDDILLFPYQEEGGPAGSTIDGYFANISGTRREGIEAGMELPAGPLEFQLRHAWTRATYQADGIEIFSIRTEAGGDNTVARGDRIPLVPEHVTAISGAWSISGAVTLGVNVSRTGAAYLRGDEANEEATLDPYLLVGASAGVELGAWRLQLVATNLLDERYATFGTFNINQGAGGVVERFLTPGTPRRFQVSIQRRWGP